MPIDDMGRHFTIEWGDRSMFRCYSPRLLVDFDYSEEVVEPFTPQLIRKDPAGRKVISYGLSSAGYDLRAHPEWMIPDHCILEPHDVKDPKPHDWRGPYFEEHFDIPPNSFVLTRSVEYIRVPRNCEGEVFAKSTYARVGLVMSGVLEPGWQGHLTIEIHNTSRRAVRVYANEGVCQMTLKRTKTPNTTYDKGNRKYQGQTGITLPKV